MALSGSATSGGGGSIFADSATSAPAPLADLWSDFLESIRDEALSGGFPDFVAGPNLAVLLSGALVPDDLVSGFLATEGVVLEDFVLDDCACACGRVLVAGFFALDLAFAMTW
jgi:hypothetical protein